MGQKVAPVIWVAGAGAGLLVAAVLAMGSSLFTSRPAEKAAPGAPAPAGAPARPAPAPAPLASEGVAKAPAAVAEAAPLAGPEFDTFSHAKDGSAVLAGRAPGAVRVELFDEAAILAEARPDRRGQFAMLFDLPPAASARSLRLRAYGPDGAMRVSADSLMVAPAPAALMAALAPAAGPESAPPQVAEAAAPPPGPGAAPAPAESSATSAGGPSAPVAQPEPAVEGATARAEAPATPPAAQIPAAAPAAPGLAVVPPAAPGVAPSNLLVSDAGVTVLRDQGRAGLSIDSILYGAEGSVEVAGHGAPEATVRLYLDNQRPLDVQADAAGKWQVELPAVTPGLYTLRADQTAAGGQVTARAETPFLREDPGALAGAGGNGQSGVVTVQPGYTLWAIARARFGDGQQYVKVFEANRDQIRDPDLIYPGQVFTLPQ